MCILLFNYVTLFIKELTKIKEGILNIDFGTTKTITENPKSFVGETNQRKNVSETNDPLLEILLRVSLGKNKL